jgi:hypothetical protein
LPVAERDTRRTIAFLSKNQASLSKRIRFGKPHDEECKLFPPDYVRASRPGSCAPRTGSHTAPTPFDVQNSQEQLMMWKRTNKSMVGVDIGSSSVKAVELQGKNGDFQLVSLGYESLQPDSVVDGQIMELNSVSNAIGNIFNEHKIKRRRLRPASMATR